MRRKHDLTFLVVQFLHGDDINLQLRRQIRDFTQDLIELSVVYSTITPALWRSERPLRRRQPGPVRSHARTARDPERDQRVVVSHQLMREQLRLSGAATAALALCGPIWAAAGCSSLYLLL